MSTKAIEEEDIPLSEQLDRLPESELVQKVRQDFFRTGTCRIEDLYRILGDFSRDIHVVPDDELPTLSSLKGIAPGCSGGLDSVSYVRSIRDAD